MKTLVLLIVVGSFLSGCVATVAEQPPHNVAVVPPSPGAGYVWVGDSWVWNGHANHYEVQRGHWVTPRRHPSVWVEGHWQQTRHGWHYVQGHWRH